VTGRALSRFGQVHDVLRGIAQQVFCCRAGIGRFAAVLILGTQHCRRHFQLTKGAVHAHETILVTFLLALTAASPLHSETDYTDREQYNPQHDPDIDRGYEQNQGVYSR
jgi:hypothetical protein